ncbi:MAG: toxin-antitoxin system YwqK family antitoxin [Verrucomicrobia bacterium]|nr:toxin-antitoxin system YwqK family antitoxin [Verrucomicrobiota bacterium]
MENPPPRSGTRSPNRVAGVLVVVVILVAGVWSFTRTSNRIPAPERAISELVRRDGALYEKGAEKRFAGWLVERTSGGDLQSRSWISNGVLNGVSEGWYTNGVLQIREHFVNGLSEGPVSRWRSDGTLASEGQAQGGKLQGVFRRWHPNGQLAEEVHLQSGEPHGLARAWFPSGSVKSEVSMERGKVVSQRFWKDGENPGTHVVAASPQHP